MRLEDVLQRAAERQKSRQGAVTMRRATITFDGPDAAVVYEALRPETGRGVAEARVCEVAWRNQPALRDGAGANGAFMYAREDDREALKKELEEHKEPLTTRVKSIKKQEKSLSERYEDLAGKIQSALGTTPSAAESR